MGIIESKGKSLLNYQFSKLQNIINTCNNYDDITFAFRWVIVKKQ